MEHADAMAERVISCELSVGADSTRVTVTPSDGCTAADVLDMCHVVLANEYEVTR